MLGDLGLRQTRDLLKTPDSLLPHLVTLEAAGNQDEDQQAAAQHMASRVWEHLNPVERSQLQKLVRQRGGTGLDLKDHMEAVLPKR